MDQHRFVLFQTTPQTPRLVAVNLGRKGLDFQDGAMSPSSGQSSSWEPGESHGAEPTPDCSGTSCVLAALLPCLGKTFSPRMAKGLLRQGSDRNTFTITSATPWGKLGLRRQVSYAVFPVAVCKGNISFIGFALWNGNV